MPDITINADAIATYQSTLTTQWHKTPPSIVATPSPLNLLVQENHLRNFQLWHEKNIARSESISPERAHQATRTIDRCSEERNNFIEKIDELLVKQLSPALVTADCPRNSETPGMIIDRLSILALKEYHMREQTLRTDATHAYIQGCKAKLTRITQQRSELTQSLAELLAAVTARRRTFTVQYQFKIYNTPTQPSLK